MKSYYEHYSTYTGASTRADELRLEGATATVLDRTGLGDPTCKYTVQYEVPTAPDAFHKELKTLLNQK